MRGFLREGLQSSPGSCKRNMHLLEDHNQRLAVHLKSIMTRSRTASISSSWLPFSACNGEHLCVNTPAPRLCYTITQWVHRAGSNLVILRNLPVDPFPGVYSKSVQGFSIGITYEIRFYRQRPRTLRSWSSMKSEMYSGARGDKLMKCSNAVLSAFWNVLSLANAAPTILHHNAHA